MATAKIEHWADIRELVKMSMGTNKGAWWADLDFGSELWLLRQKGKIDGQTAGALRQMVLQATQWLVTDKIVNTIDCQAERTGKHEIPYTVTVVQPNGDSALIKEVWNVL
jgi:phage gp46-like protein